jgi:hypothetical protein
MQIPKKPSYQVQNRHCQKSSIEAGVIVCICQYLKCNVHSVLIIHCLECTSLESSCIYNYCN